MKPARVVAITATYRRAVELAALLASLESERGLLTEVAIVDNANDALTARVAAEARVPARVITPERNLGCGGGVAVGMAEALRDAAVTHVWLFDDDAQATQGALALLLDGTRSASAEVAVPLVSNGAGHIGWFPGPLVQPAWDMIRSPRTTPAQFRAKCGIAPLEWQWAPWPSLLVSRHAVETVGYPRTDYWFQGEDLEWTLRLSAKVKCVLVPGAECRHLPPPARRDRARLKHAAMLQNNLFTATRLSHGRRALRHAPGNVLRFFRVEGFSWTTLKLALQAHWFGALRGRPAGASGANVFQRKWQALG